MSFSDYVDQDLHLCWEEFTRIENCVTSGNIGENQLLPTNFESLREFYLQERFNSVRLQHCLCVMKDKFTSNKTTLNERILSITGTHANCWMNAYHGSNFFKFSDVEFEISLKFHFGLKVTSEEMYCKCGAIADSFGDHFHSCKQLSNKIQDTR